MWIVVRCWEKMNLALKSDLNFLGFQSQLCLPPIVDNTSMKHSLFASSIEMEVMVFWVLELSLPSSQGPFGTWVKEERENAENAVSEEIRVKEGFQTETSLRFHGC